MNQIEIGELTIRNIIRSIDIKDTDKGQFRQWQILVVKKFNNKI